MAELIGLNQFENELKKLTEKMRGEVLRRALLKSVQPLVQAAGTLAPRGSGKLSRSMTAQSMKFASIDEAIVRVGPGRPEGSHGILLERGTVNMTGRPFLVFAHVATHQEVINRTQSEVSGELLRITDPIGGI